jgi:hypothetical protein
MPTPRFRTTRPFIGEFLPRRTVRVSEERRARRLSLAVEGLEARVALAVLSASGSFDASTSADLSTTLPDPTATGPGHGSLLVADMTGFDYPAPEAGAGVGESTGVAVGDWVECDGFKPTTRELRSIQANLGFYGHVDPPSSAKLSSQMKANLTYTIRPQDGSGEKRDQPIGVSIGLSASYDDDLFQYPNIATKTIVTITGGGKSKSFDLSSAGTDNRDNAFQFETKIEATFTVSFDIHMQGTWTEGSLSAPGGSGPFTSSLRISLGEFTPAPPAVIQVVQPTYDRTDGGVDLGYTISGAPLPRATTIALFWASGTTFDTKIDTPENGGQPIYSAITEVNPGSYPTDGPIHVTRGRLENPPPDATYVLAVVDPDNPFNPFDATTVKALLYSAPSISTVTDSLKASTAPKVFGNYLHNVPIADTFTVATADPFHIISKVTYRIDTIGPTDATPDGKGQWTFDPNVATLPAEGLNAITNNTLRITAYDANNVAVGAPYSVTLVVQNDLHVALKATLPGGADGGVNVTSLRFIKGIALPSQFEGTISDLPGYYLPYLKKFGLRGKALGDATASGSGSNVKFAFSYDPGQLTGDAKFLPIFVTPQATAPAPGGDSEVVLHAITLPAWMGNLGLGDKKYDSANGGAYKVNLTFPPGLSAKLDATSGFPDTFSMFNGLQSSMAVGLHLQVIASPSLDGPTPSLVARDWVAQATLLGQPLLAAGSRLDTGPVKVQADLNRQTLDVSSIVIQTDAIPLAAPNKKLFDFSFGTGKKKFVIPIPGLPLAVTGDVELEGEIKAKLTKLIASAALKIDIKGSNLSFDDKASYFQIDAGAGVGLSIGTKGVAGVGILAVPVFSVNVLGIAAKGDLWAAVDGTFRISIGGGVLKPTVSFDKAHSTASLYAGYVLNYAYRFFKSDPPIDPNNPDRIVSDPYQKRLFGPGKPDQPTFTNPANLTLKGAGKTDPTTEELGPAPVVQPLLPLSVHTGSALDRGEPETSALRPRSLTTPAAAVSRPTSTLTVTTPLYGPVAGIHFDLNILADHAKLTAGHHFLDAVLVAPDGLDVSLAHIDLATSSLTVDAGPLGYSAGNRTINAAPPTGSLIPGKRYRIEFRLTNDLDGTGEAVAIAVKNLVVAPGRPSLSLTTPLDGTLDFGPDTKNSAIATIHLTNRGLVPLHVSGVTVGAGFAVLDGKTGPFVLYPGGSLDRRVRLLDPGRRASATLRIASDDPLRPVLTLPLRYNGTAIKVTKHTAK